MLFTGPGQGGRAGRMALFFPGQGRKASQKKQHEMVEAEDKNTF